MGAYDSVYLETVIIVFMLLAGTNFSLHIFAFRSRFRVYLRDPEWRFYLGIIGGATVGLAVFLWWRTTYPPAHALRLALFQVVSMVTTTGFATADFEQWPVFSQYTLLLLMFFGGCAGSTGGAIKHMRIILLLKHAYWQLYRLLHPRAVLPVRLGKQTVSEEVLLNVQAFFGLYMVSFVLTALYLTLLDMDIITAISAAASAIGNVGPGLEGIGPLDDYAWMPVSVKWLLSACMLLGRLEFSALLVLCLPSFWKQ